VGSLDAHADEALNDDELLEIIQQELSKCRRKSKTRGRPSTTAEVVLRMLLLKHMRSWSFADVTREVRANLVYREFTGVGGRKVPDDKTMGRLARQLGPEAIEKLHRRTVATALKKEVVADGCGWIPRSMLRHCAIPCYLSENRDARTFGVLERVQHYTHSGSFLNRPLKYPVAALISINVLLITKMYNDLSSSM
jgi:hypothetical protein